MEGPTIHSCPDRLNTRTMFSGMLKPDDESAMEFALPEFNVSYKPQKISPKFQGTVRTLLHKKVALRLCLLMRVIACFFIAPGDPTALASDPQHLLAYQVRESYLHPQFVSDVIKPLNIEALFDQEVQNLSGGELQRVAITLCLGTPADIYLIDEPSAYLDSEQRIVASKVPACPSPPMILGCVQLWACTEFTFGKSFGRDSGCQESRGSCGVGRNPITR